MKNFWDEEVSRVLLCNMLQENWIQIRDETLNYLNTVHPYKKDGATTLPYPKFQVNNDYLYEGKWGIAPIGLNESDDEMKIWGVKKNFLEKLVKWQTGTTIEENNSYAAKMFPVLNEIIFKYGSNVCQSAAISVLSPGTVIKPHRGAENFIRCHLCLVNDEGCSITVNGETRKWEEGKILAFNDGDQHSVIHEGSKDRIVLIFDMKMEHVKGF